MSFRLTPRDYQYDAVNSFFTYFEEGNTGHPLCAMPTGTGKSVVIAYFLYQVMQRYANQKVLVLTHVKELIEQNFNKLLALWPTAPAGIYSAGLKRRDLHNRIIFAGIASLIRQVKRLGHVDLIMIDEAHLVSPNEHTMYRKLIDALTAVNPNLKVLGLTATPWRLGHGHLTDEGGLFTDLCIDMTTLDSFNWFIREGYLLPPVPYKPAGGEFSVDGVKKVGGEFAQGALMRAVDRDELTQLACEESLKVAANRHKWLVFCAGVEHCIHAADTLNAMGVPAAAVHSKMNPAERDAVLQASKQGRIRAITNNNVLTTGYDDPEIDFILMLRPTASPVLWVQMLGRGTRPVYAPGYDLSTTQGRLDSIFASQKQDCLVLDYGGNTRRIGPINDPVIPNRKGKKGGPPPVKECPQCGLWNHASVRHCEACGFEFVFETKLTAGASTDELIKEAAVPEVVDFDVDYVTYNLHRKPGRPASLKVTYYSGVRRFIEYVCLGHSGGARSSAMAWWRKRTDIPVPDNAADGMALSNKLRETTAIKVWVNKTYPEIIGHVIASEGEPPTQLQAVN